MADITDIEELKNYTKSLERALFIIASMRNGKVVDLRPYWRIAEEALSFFPLIHEELHEIKADEPPASNHSFASVSKPPE